MQFTNFALAQDALVQTLNDYGDRAVQIPEISLQGNVYFIDLRPNTGYLAVNILTGRAFRVAKIGELEGENSHCSPELYAHVLDKINQALNELETV